MNDATVVCGAGAAVLAVGAGARSTWSPCGLSMLSSITPMGERGRGTRFAVTAGWFVAGAVVGGLTLGLAQAGLAAALGALAPAPAAVAALCALAALVAAASDSRLGGWSLPIHRRQVNELWLDRYRPWVYGAGFGWQIGAGLATYVMTAALYAVIVLCALSGAPLLALAVGGLFGLVRGLAVLLGRGLTTPQRMADFHRRFSAAGPRVAAAVVALEVAVGAAAAGLLWAPAAPLVLAGAGALALRRRRSAQRSPNLLVHETGA